MLPYVATMPQIDYAVRNTRVLARHGLRYTRNRLPAPEGLPEAVRELADAVWALGAQYESPERSTQLRRLALSAAMRATEIFEREPDLAVTEIVGQVRSVAVDLLRAADELAAPDRDDDRALVARRPRPGAHRGAARPRRVAETPTRRSGAPRLPGEAADGEHDRADAAPERQHEQRDPRLSATPSPVTIAPDSPSMRCLSGSTSAMSRRNARRVLGVVEDAGDEDHGQEHGVDVGRRRVEVRDDVRERDAERGEAAHADDDEDGEREPVAAASRAPKTTRAGDGDDRRSGSPRW